MDKTTLYLPAKLHRRIRAIARRSGRPQAAVIREALQEYIDRQEPPPLASLGIAKDVRLSGVDVEDWLHANWRPEDDWGREPDPPAESEASPRSA